MKYADYKREDLIFLKKTTDRWTINEKKEFLDSCPENEGLAETIEQLKALAQALEDGEVKCNRYGEINKSSMKAYLNRHDTNIRYGKANRYYYGDSKDFYFNVDGVNQTFNYKSNITDHIKKYGEESDIERRFERLANEYASREKHFAEQIEQESYKAINADRIAANKKLDKVLDHLRIEIPASVETDKYGYVNALSRSMMNYDFKYSHNNYGEILVNNRPLSEDRATELMNTILEMSAKISDIMDEYRDTIKAALGNK